MEPVAVLRQGARLRIYTWAEGSDCPVGQFLRHLPERERRSVYRLLRRAADYWPMPLKNRQKCRKLRGYDNLYEFKVGQIRILFFLDHSGNIILTNEFQKKQDRTPQTEIDRALRIRDLWTGSTGGET